ncbi:MAG: hypothetical protein EHM48_06785, partial [Planctomycetaceae bacterium]
MRINLRYDRLAVVLSAMLVWLMFVHIAALASQPARAPATAETKLVPFVIPADVNDQSLIAMRFDPVKTDSPRVVVTDGHFYIGKQRYRVWGVNLSFGANFPDHEQARRTARRLAAFGINCVRLHHMDGASFPDGI